MKTTSAASTPRTTGHPDCSKCLLLAEKDAVIQQLKAEKSALEDKFNKFLESSADTKAQANLLKDMLFGRSSEKICHDEPAKDPGEAADDIAPREPGPHEDDLAATGDPGPGAPDTGETGTGGPKRPRRKRWAQHGHKGSGRKIPEGLPVSYRVIEVPEEGRYCPACGQEGEDHPFTEDSSEIDTISNSHL